MRKLVLQFLESADFIEFIKFGKLSFLVLDLLFIVGAILDHFADFVVLDPLRDAEALVVLLEVLLSTRQC